MKKTILTMVAMLAAGVVMAAGTSTLPQNASVTLNYTNFGLVWPTNPAVIGMAGVGMTNGGTLHFTNIVAGSKFLIGTNQITVMTVTNSAVNGDFLVVGVSGGVTSYYYKSASAFGFITSGTVQAGTVIATNTGTNGMGLFLTSGSPSGVQTGYWATVGGGNLKDDGTVPMAAPLNMGTYRITNMGDAVAAQDAVTLTQAQGMTQGLVTASVTNGLASVAYVDAATGATDIVRLGKANNFTVKPQVNGLDVLVFGDAAGGGGSGIGATNYCWLWQSQAPVTNSFRESPVTRYPSTITRIIGHAYPGGTGYVSIGIADATNQAGTYSSTAWTNLAVAEGWNAIDMNATLTNNQRWVVTYTAGVNVSEMSVGVFYSVEGETNTVRSVAAGTGITITGPGYAPTVNVDTATMATRTYAESLTNDLQNKVSATNLFLLRAGDTSAGSYTFGGVYSSDYIGWDSSTKMTRSGYDISIQNLNFTDAKYTLATQRLTLPAKYGHTEVVNVKTAARTETNYAANVEYVNTVAVTNKTQTWNWFVKTPKTNDYVEGPSSPYNGTIVKILGHCGGTGYLRIAKSDSTNKPGTYTSVVWTNLTLTPTWTGITVSIAYTNDQRWVPAYTSGVGCSNMNLEIRFSE